MNYKMLCLTAILLLTACNTSDVKLEQYKPHDPLPIEVNNILSIKERSCSVVYNATSIWIVEKHCTSENKQGLYIIDSSGATKFNWFDSTFNTWAWNEGCNTKDDCYYIVTVNSNGKITSFTYKFYINLSEGYYKIKIKDSKLVVTEKSITDHPS